MTRRVFTDARLLSRRTKDDSGAWRRESVDCTIALGVDVEALMDMLGTKALLTKHKRATALHGAVQAQVIEQQKD